MARKLGPDAFEFYFALGPGRSYRAVAERFGVARRTVAAAAAEGDWAGAVLRREREAAKRAEDQAVGDLAAMRARHLQILQFVQARAVETLKALPLGTGYQAAAALLRAISEERLARGEPTVRAEVSLRDLVRREAEAWLETDGEGDAEHGDGDAHGDAHGHGHGDGDAAEDVPRG